MTKIPIRPASTLDAIASVKEAKKDDYIRPYLGMSGVGAPCDRQSWANFRWLTNRADPAWLQDAASCGYIAEDEMAKDLRLLPEITLITEGFGSDNQDKSTNQIAFSDHNGHFKGHADGMILGILEAPKTWHVWEHKDKDDLIKRDKQTGKWKSSASKIKELADLIDKVGEKEALREWDFTYYVQAQLYMHYSGYKRHYLTASKGVKRQRFSVRTEYSKTTALEYREKAHDIIEMPYAPERRYGDTHYYCKYFCNHYDWCHNGAEMVKSCRSCKHAVPIMEEEYPGLWGCKKIVQVLDPDMQKYMACGGEQYEPIEVV